VEPRGSNEVLTLSGPIHIEAASELREEALRLAAGGRPFAVDWGDAEFVGGSAVQVLLALAQSAGGPDGSLRVARDNPGVRRLLECAGLAGRFRVEPPGV
jgi:anti-anti-sigma factor